MSLVWLFHPTLPGQDIKVDRSALGNYARSGWQERADQSDPIDPDTITDQPAASDAPTAKTPTTTDEHVADEPVTTTKKGRS